MAPRQEFDLDSLSSLVPTIFDQAQSSAATHKKNCVALHKLQTASAKVQERGRNSELKLVGERAFGEVVLDLVNRVLVVKKSTPAADRIVKFIGSYVRYAYEKGTYSNIIMVLYLYECRVESEEEDSSSSRFITRLLRHLLKGFEAKSKDVRFRCLGFVSEIISNLGEMEYVSFMSEIFTY